MTVVTQHLVNRSDGAVVEVFQVRADAAAGAILFVHGNQGGLQLGGKALADSGALQRFSSGLNITAAAVSQPGFGASDGPADFCGPRTQQAILTALSFLRAQPCVDPARIVLYGNSRGAVASAMVAAQVSDLRALILSGGVYDLRAAYDCARPGLRQAIESEAGTSAQAMTARSALHHAARIRSQTLLLHGSRDDRAPLSQAEAFRDALSDAGVPVALHVFDCGHDIPREDARHVLRPFLKSVFDGRVTRH
jgi:dipeptidyl aminopeptidase/acylaminoacyl peptidase